MKEDIEKIKTEVADFVISAKDSLEEYRLKFLSKNGSVSKLFENFRNLAGEEKKSVGQLLNQLKNAVQQKFDEEKERLENQAADTGNDEDYTLPSVPNSIGSRHPLAIVQNQMLEIFSKTGFTVAQGPEIETDWYNFSALNFPENHPARDMQDTFFVDVDTALRTHTSSVQVRVMESQQPPIRIMAPGRVYRNEAVSARANCFFHQIEGLYIDKGVSFADLKQTLYYFVKEFFGSDVEVRFRPSYFPFTEPSAEMDITCLICKGKGCNICKYSGWVEILGSGMVDPQVLANCKIDPEIYSGYAFGIGIERITMMKYDVKDLRIFFDNDVRFLRQFRGVF